MTSRATEMRAATAQGEQKGRTQLEDGPLPSSLGRRSRLPNKGFEKFCSLVFSSPPQPRPRSTAQSTLRSRETSGDRTHGGDGQGRGDRRVPYRGQDPEVIPAHVPQLGHIHLPHGRPGPEPQPPPTQPERAWLVGTPPLAHAPSFLSGPCW